MSLQSLGVAEIVFFVCANPPQPEGLVIRDAILAVNRVATATVEVLMHVCWLTDLYTKPLGDGRFKTVPLLHLSEEMEVTVLTGFSSEILD